jgi:hypothetical protein
MIIFIIKVNNYRQAQIYVTKKEIFENEIVFKLLICRIWFVMNKFNWQIVYLIYKIWSNTCLLIINLIEKLKIFKKY